MRMHEYDYNDQYWVNLFNLMYEKGIKRHHVSLEYDSFKRYCQVLKTFYSKYPKKNISHIVKLAEPNFDYHIFDIKNIEEKIIFYKKMLMTNKIDTIQWMWRGDLKNDNIRINDYISQKSKIQKYIELAKNNKDFENFYFFPYTLDFARICILENCVDGIIVYRNPKETLYDDLIQECNSLNKKCITIRPFESGKAFKRGFNSRDLYSFAFNLNSIDGIITSISRMDYFSEDNLFSV